MKNNTRRILVLMPLILLGLTAVGLIVLGLTTSRPATAQSHTADLVNEAAIHAADAPPIAAPAQDSTVWIDPPASSVSPGEEFTVTVCISDATDLGGYEFSMGWNASVLTVTNVVDASFLGSTGRTLIPIPPDIEPGTLTFAVGSVGEQAGPDGSGPLAIITLEALGVGTSTLDLYDVTLFDTANPPGQTTPMVEDGTVEVIGLYQIFLPFVARNYP